MTTITDLDELNHLLPEDFEQFDILRHATELLDSFLLALLLWLCSILLLLLLALVLLVRLKALSVPVYGWRRGHRAGWWRTPLVGHRDCFSGWRRRTAAVLPRVASLFDFLRQSTSRCLFLSFGLFGVLTLRLARGVRCKAVNERDDNLLDVDLGV